MLNTKQLADLIDSASRLRTRVVWLVGMPGSGKTNELKAIAAGQADCQYVNLNAALSSRLTTDSPDQQPFKAGQHLGAILSPRSTGSWLIDNVEILLSRKLKIRVVDQLNSLAQQATLVVAWPGTIENGRLTYGARNHPDFMECSIDTPLVLNLNENNQGQ